MVEPNWAAMGENRYTSLVSTLLTRLYPDVEIIDGAGGDGGRDAQRRIGGRLIVYQWKYFSGRVDDTQRKQVLRSLKAVTASAPDEWYLIMPTQLTPGEIKWFDGLKKDDPFVTAWHGKFWLNSHLARHHDILRLYSDANAEVVSSLIQLQKEQAVLLGGVPDLVSRVDGLTGRAGEVSVDYGMRFGVDRDGTRVEIFAKDPGRARPISFTTHLVPHGDPAEFERITAIAEEVLDFGGRAILAKPYLHSVTVDAPSELGIAGTSHPDWVEFGSVDDGAGLPVDGCLKIVTAAGLTAAYLQVTFTLREAGRRGWSLFGHGPGQLVTVRVRFVEGCDVGSIDLALDPVAFASPPGSVAGAVGFLATVVPGHTLQLSVADIEAACEIDKLPFAGYAGWLPALTGLADIQARFGYQFNLPDPFTGADAWVIAQVQRLLAGEAINGAKGPIRVHVNRDKLDAFLDQDEHGGAIVIAHEHTRLRIGGHSIDLGPGFWAANVRLANRRRLEKLRGKPGDRDPEAVLELVDASHMQLRLGDLPLPTDPAAERSSGPGPRSRPSDDDRAVSGAR